MDDDTVLAAARSDPTGFVRALDRTTIDEVQRVPDLLRAIKKSVDDDRRAGRFLLTGSANIFTLPQVSESLAGRMEIVSLLPLSRAEIRGKKPGFLKAAFDSKLGKPAEPMIGKDLVQAVLIGGYPEMLRREDPKRRQTWARDYIRAIVQRDVREVADVEKLDQMPRLFRFSPTTLDNSPISRRWAAKLDLTTRPPGSTSRFWSSCFSFVGWNRGFGTS